MRADLHTGLPENGIETLISLLKVATRIALPMRDSVADPEGLSVTELRILLALGGEGALGGRELANLMALQPMNVSRALATLAQMGFVEETSDPANRRRKPYQLSHAGRDKFTAMQPELHGVAEFVFGVLSASERKRIGQLLERLDQRLRSWEEPAAQKHVKRA